jgi:hypothetical protein
MTEDKKKYIPLLNVLKKLKPKEIEGILDFLNDDAIDNICECVYNVIHTDLKLPSKKKSKLRNFIKSNCSVHRLNKISSKKEALFKRRKALKQEGKGLPMILATAIPFLIDLIFGKK